MSSCLHHKGNLSIVKARLRDIRYEEVRGTYLEGLGIPLFHFDDGGHLAQSMG